MVNLKKQYDKLMCSDPEFYQAIKKANPDWVEKKKKKAAKDWFDLQRQLYKEGKLDSYQINKLESLQGWTWEVSE